MAVNNDCSECYNTHDVPGSSNGDNQITNGPPRSTTASPKNGRASPPIFNPYYTGRPRTPAGGTKTNAVDRQEIIKRIKSNSRPTSPELEKTSTIERQDFMRLLKGGRSRPTSPELERIASHEYWKQRRSPSARRTNTRSDDSRPRTPQPEQNNGALGLQIERPRSALHRGDFRQKEEDQLSLGRFHAAPQNESLPLSTSPIAPWHPEFPVAAYNYSSDLQRPSLAQKGIPIPARPFRDRTVSNASLTTSFVYKPPTSPLVQSSRPDTPEPSNRDRSRSPEKSRRHTFSPQSFSPFQSALEYPASTRNNGRPGLPLRSGRSFPYQAHQPRRSLNTAFASLPQTPLLALRRPSISTDSPLHHAPMVGSYEESILRGRMSTIPSRPLNFMAQIGVLGKGNCKSSLRCPPHVSVPFPAVFYSYGSGAKSSASDQPSPYVGLIDLENNLDNQDAARERRRQRRNDTFSDEGSRNNSPRGARDDGSASDVQAKRLMRQKVSRRSGFSRAPSGGSYRIPQHGQLQIVIKNPNKTAVKLFLVPYDLSEMEPGQKTFIRQRSYSAGPIIDMPLSSRKNLGTDRPEAALSATGDPNDRPTLRYLIHLHICCTSKGRYFLYKSIRVVFANRVPDGKEKLRNEIQFPEPRFSVYKPSRDSNASQASAVFKDNHRRRSAMEPGQREDIWPTTPPSLTQSTSMQEQSNTFSRPMPTLPRHSTMLPIVESRPASRQQLSDRMDVDSVSPSTSSMMRSPVSSNGDVFEKVLPRLDDPFNFPRDSSHERNPSGRNQSLLSRRLMDLAFQQQGRQGGNDEN